jgi:hypothetical protein
MSDKQKDKYMDRLTEYIVDKIPEDADFTIILWHKEGVMHSSPFDPLYEVELLRELANKIEKEVVESN